MRIRISVVAAAAAFVLAAAGPPAAGAATIAGRPTLEARVVHRINLVREAHGLHRVRVVARLSGAAHRHAGSMGAAAYFRHGLFTPKRDPDWTSFGRWIRWFYPGPGYSSWSAGENLAWGAPGIGARETVARWMASPMHRANVLEPSWRNVGVGAVHVTAPTGYWRDWDSVTIVVADFGRRS